MPLSAFFGLALGVALGAFADRLAARWPRHQDGRVRGPDWRSAVLIVGSGLAFAALAARWPDPVDFLVVGVYVAALIVLLAVDLDQMLLPDVITLPLIAYALTMVLLGFDPLLAGKDQALVSALVAAVAAPLLLLVSDRLLRGSLGMGDVKLSVSLGLMCGLSRLFGGFLLASVVFAAVLLVLIASRRLTLRTAVPFGPVLIAAGILAALLA